MQILRYTSGEARIFYIGGRPEDFGRMQNVQFKRFKILFKIIALVVLAMKETLKEASVNDFLNVVNN